MTKTELLCRIYDMLSDKSFGIPEDLQMGSIDLDGKSGEFFFTLTDNGVKTEYVLTTESFHPINWD